MFSIKILGDDGQYTVHGCDSYCVGRTVDGLRSVSFWSKGAGVEPGFVIVDGEVTPMVYVMGATGKTIDRIWPTPRPETAP